jgi:hypothetical protein
MKGSFAPSGNGLRQPHPKQVAFEAARVRLLLQKFGIPHQEAALADHFERKWGVRRLTFESFYESHPSFPVLLEAHSFYGVAAKCPVIDLFRHFERTFIYQRYLNVYERGRREEPVRPVGMVFPYDGFQGGLVIHNGHFETHGFRWVYEVPGGHPPHRLTVEPYLAFLRYLARGPWNPSSGA